MKLNEWLFHLQLDKKDWKKFGLFLNSPYHNSSKPIVQIYKMLSKKWPFDNNICDNDFRKWGKSAERLKSEFLKLLEEFLELEELKNYKTYKKRLLVTSLMKRKFYESVLKIIDLQNRKQQENSAIDIRYYLDSYLLKEPILYLNNINETYNKNERDQEVLNAFMDYVLSNTLRLYNALLRKERMFAITFKYPIHKDLLFKFLDMHTSECPPLALGYYYSILLLENPNDEDTFEKMLQLINDHSSSFKSYLQRDLYTTLVNFCLRQIRSGHTVKYRTILHYRIYLKSLELNIWLDDTYFNTRHFYMIVKNALTLPNLTIWVWDFIEQYESKINPKFHFVTKLVKALYFFHERNFMEVKSLLLSDAEEVDKPKGFHYVVYAKTLLIKLHYEENDLEKGLSLLRSLRLYLSRNVLMSGTTKEAYAAFEKLATRLFRYNEKADEKNMQFRATIKKPDKLKQDIKDAPSLWEREWLIEKVMAFY